MLSRLKEFLQSWNLSHLFKKPKVLQSSSLQGSRLTKLGLLKEEAAKTLQKYCFEFMKRDSSVDFASEATVLFKFYHG